ncbi:hypothetical protein [Pseudonocardia sp. MH-G8]|uniref:hypothetical protein n=1 Tax=Pseudonocardia sp. MH-G8 TaxID=1854588 RepID=UPI000BA0686B|nr:hypothetical protein [Pseudonocardia sp. MH-G8]OZM77756.1 hypothetical protein CFP66_33865 [Pseudonocardia sp. MH-G8]
MDLSSRRRSSRELSSRGESVGMMWKRARRARAEERSARMLHAAERSAQAAAAHYRELRAAAGAGAASPTVADGGAPRGPMPTWQQLLLLIIGGGLLSGLLVIWLLAAAYVGPVAMLVLPTIAGMVAGFIVLRRRHPPAPKARRHRPSVADLVRATQELHDAEAALQRARGVQQETDDPAPQRPPVTGSRAARPPWPAPGAPQT